MSPRPLKWTPSELHNEGKKYKTKQDFRNGSPSAFQTAAKLGLLDSVCAHMPEQRHANYTLAGIMSVAKNYKNRSLFRSEHKALYNAAQSNGWLDHVLEHMDASTHSHPRGYWTKDKCLEVAATCPTYGEFRQKYQWAYVKSLREGWIDDISLIFEKKQQK